MNEFRTSESRSKLHFFSLFSMYATLQEKFVWAVQTCMCNRGAAFCEIEHCATLNVSCNSGLAKAQMQQVKLLLWPKKAQVRCMKHKTGEGKDK